MCFNFELNDSKKVGIPLTTDLHEQFSEDVKEAFKTFHQWWQQNHKSPKLINMSTKVKEAYTLIRATEIPGYPGITCDESCYIKSVNSKLT